jgi:RNA polymerase sigma-70 factor (ECF subfamily)
MVGSVKESDFIRDEELMLQFQQGDEASFRILVDRHKQRVFNFTYRFMNGNADSEDVAQEVFVKVYFSKDNYKPSAKFTTWLYVVTKNTCLQALKKKGKTVSMNEKTEGRRDEIGSVIADERTENPSDAVLSAEKRGKIAEALARLPESQRMVILLRRYDQLSYEEIAEVIGCSVQSVKSLLFRGRASLKGFLKEYFNERH